MIKEKYAESVNINIIERIPLKEFLVEVANSDIVVDQALTYEYGYNALYGMAMGKVVLSGNNSLEFNVNIKLVMHNVIKNPVIDISPNSEQIYNVLEELILNPEKIKKYGKSSYNYVRLVHNFDKVASIYANLYMSTLKNLK